MFDKINEEFNLSGNFNVNANNKRNINNNINNATCVIALRYKGEGRHKIITSINKAVKKILPQNYVTQNVYESKKVGSYYNMKYSTKLNINMAFLISPNTLK